MPVPPCSPRRPWRTTMLSNVIDSVFGSDRSEHRDRPAQNVHEIERWASGLGGGLVAVLGQETRSQAARIGLTLLGGYLVYRGISGRCPLYSALGFRTDVPH